MMASGEIRLSGTTMRRMPVLAQSQVPGGATVWSDPNDPTQPIYAYGTYYGTAPVGLVGPEFPDAVWNYNLAPFAAAATRININRTLAQFTAASVGLAAVTYISPFAGIGAVTGGIGGYQARGLDGIVPGTVTGGTLGLGGGLLGDILAEEGIVGLRGTLAVMGVGGVSGFSGAVSVNIYTGNENTFEGSISGGLIGMGAPLMSGEALAIGGTGITSIAAPSLNALSGVFTVGATAAVGP